MHPQGNSTSYSQQSHMPQNLSNIHSNPSPAHNYSSQHPYSLSVSSMNQNLDQPPTSNHPPTNPAVGQSYLQKSNHLTFEIVQTTHSQTTTVQHVAHIAPQIPEQPPPEKSQANGTSEGEPSQRSFVQSGFSLTSKEKSPVQTVTSVQGVEVDGPSVQAKAVEASALPVPAKTSDSESVTPSSSPEVLNSKSTKEVRAPKEAGISPSVSTVGTDKPLSMSIAALEMEQDPLHIPEKDNPGAPYQLNKAEAKMAGTKQGRKVEKIDLYKNVDPLALDPVKSAVPVDGPAKARQKELLDVKPISLVKATTRKTKTASSQDKAGTSTASSSAKRPRIRTQHYQSPLPEVEFVSKLSSTSMRHIDEKLIVFYKNEFLAVRNAEGGFYLCRAVQNIYKSSPKIKIRWLSQDKNAEKGEAYTPDFYDLIDFDCILTNLSLNKADKGRFILPPSEKARTQSILNRSLAVEKGEEIASPSLTEEHPDGLDLSLYRDEDQLKKRKGRKRRRKAKPSPAPKQTPTKKSPIAPKVRKVAPPVKETAKPVVLKKPPIKPTRRTAVIPVETKPVISPPKSSKVSGKSNSKPAVKSSPVVDQKKAKVFARIGRKAAVAPAATKATKNNSKNGKAGNKAAVSSNKTVQAKSSSNGSVKTTTRSVRKSTRK